MPCALLAAGDDLCSCMRMFCCTGIPLLVLGNKNDLPGALSTTDLIDRLDLKVGATRGLCGLCLLNMTVQRGVVVDLGSMRCAQGLPDREVCVYSISCRSQNNIDITLDWLTKHAKS